MPLPEFFFDMVFPFAGIERSGEFSQQRFATAAVGENVRAFEPMTGRSRGGRRSGLSRFIDSVVVHSSEPVQHLALVVNCQSGGDSSAGLNTDRPEGYTNAWTGDRITDPSTNNQPQGNFIRNQLRGSIIPRVIRTDPRGGGNGRPQYRRDIEVASLNILVQSKSVTDSFVLVESGVHVTTLTFDSVPGNNSLIVFSVGYDSSDNGSNIQVGTANMGFGSTAIGTFQTMPHTPSGALQNYGLQLFYVQADGTSEFQSFNVVIGDFGTYELKVYAVEFSVPSGATNWNFDTESGITQTTPATTWSVGPLTPSQGTSKLAIAAFLADGLNHATPQNNYVGIFQTSTANEVPGTPHVNLIYNSEVTAATTPQVLSDVGALPYLGASALFYYT